MTGKYFISISVCALACLIGEGCVRGKMNTDYFIVSRDMPRNPRCYWNDNGAVIIQWNDPASMLIYREAVARKVKRKGVSEIEITLHGGIPETGSTVFKNAIQRDNDSFLAIQIGPGITPNTSIYFKDEEGRREILRGEGVADVKTERIKQVRIQN
jgi:hypothetical protein